MGPGDFALGNNTLCAIHSVQLWNTEGMPPRRGTGKAVALSNRPDYTDLSVVYESLNSRQRQEMERGVERLFLGKCDT